jgi:hypothetical protein
MIFGLNVARPLRLVQSIFDIDRYNPLLDYRISQLCPRYSLAYILYHRKDRWIDH